jgi:hypothetical protein
MSHHANPNIARRPAQDLLPTGQEAGVSHWTDQELRKRFRQFCAWLALDPSSRPANYREIQPINPTQGGIPHQACSPRPGRARVNILPRHAPRRRA